MTVGDKFDFTGLTATLGQAAKVVPAAGDFSTGTKLIAGIAAALTEAANTVWLVTIDDNVGNMDGDYLIYCVDTIFSGNDYIVKVVGATTIGVSDGDATIAS